MKSGGQLRRGRIKPISDRRRAENEERAELLHERWGRYPPCMACPTLNSAGIRTGCNGNADDGHELLSRGRGGSITDTVNVMPVGRLCHNYITTHPTIAAELGLALSRHR